MHSGAPKAGGPAPSGAPPGTVSDERPNAVPVASVGGAAFGSLDDDYGKLAHSCAPAALPVTLEMS